MEPEPVEEVVEEAIEPIVPKPPKEDNVPVADEDEIDPIVMEIRNMRSKNDVEKFMLEKYGIDVDRRKNLSDLKNLALKEYEKSLNDE